MVNVLKQANQSKHGEGNVDEKENLVGFYPEPHEGEKHC